MKITLKIGNEIITHPTVKEAERVLNEILYYSDSVELGASFTETVPYDKNTRLSHVMDDAIRYGEGWINVYSLHD